MGLDRAKDPAPVPHRVRRLEGIVITFDDVSLDVLELTAESRLDLGPRRTISSGVRPDSET
jgi:hypothetical protein